MLPGSPGIKRTGWTGKQVGVTKAKNGNKRDPRADRKVLYLDGINVNNLPVILNPSCARCFHGRKLGEEYTDYFLQLHVNLRLSQN